MGSIVVANGTWRRSGNTYGIGAHFRWNNGHGVYETHDYRGRSIVEQIWMNTVF
jgi:hypothetical protein